MEWFKKKKNTKKTPTYLVFKCACLLTQVNDKTKNRHDLVFKQSSIMNFFFFFCFVFVCPETEK